MIDANSGKDADATAGEVERPMTPLWKRAGLPVLVLAIGLLIGLAFVRSAPQAKRKPAVRQARLVEVVSASITNERVTLHAMGTVVPAREVDLVPRVSGQIIAVHDDFVPGGLFKEGTTIVKLDPVDFELAVRQMQSDVARAKGDLALEQGRQEVAQREFELLPELVSENDRTLVLREPQLEQVRATVASAEAAADQARLHLSRTAVLTPFNAVVRERHANLGMQVTPGTPLATLVGTDRYWIEASIPVSQLPWIELHDASNARGSAGADGAGSAQGSRARIYGESATEADPFRSGRVVRVLSELEEEGRMARVLIEVEDPLALKPENAGQPRMLLREYVRVEIEGREIANVTAIDRSLLRDGRFVWIMNDNDELEIHEVEIAFPERDRYLVRNGIREGAKIVSSDLSAPVDGMPLRTQDMSPAEGGP